MTAPVNIIAVDRYWFLTWTTYGTWLPGDERGFVGEVLNESGEFFNFNELNTPPAPPNSNLRDAAERVMKSPPLFLDHSQATALFEQFHETSNVSGWLLIAVAIMRSHIHVLAGVPGDPDPEKLLKAYKSYGSRKLNQGWSKPASDTWWTARGSKRKLPDEKAVTAAINYIRHQKNPLLIWTREDGLLAEVKPDPDNQPPGKN